MTKHPRRGEFELATWLDDYFGRHCYGVYFPSTDEVFRSSDIKETKSEYGNKEDFKFPTQPNRRD